MPAAEYISAFGILFNFSTNAERQEFYFRHFGNASTLGAIHLLNMKLKIYSPQNKSFSLVLPENWAEYDDFDTDENTYAFFNTFQWTGNLRITISYWTKPNDLDADPAANYIKSVLLKEKAKQIKLGSYDVAHYKDLLDDYMIYYWVMGKRNNLILCSFTVDCLKEGSNENEKELELVQDIIASIKLS